MTHTTRRSFNRLLLALPAASALHRRAEAAEEPVRIGATYPFTGVAASAGTALRDAVEVALDIVNNAHPDLDALPLAVGTGLPNLGGRKVEVSFADHQGNPATAQSQTLRLISQEHVAAMVGSYQSSCTLTSSQVAERYGIPFVAGEASAPSLTQRGFKWFFRPTPIGTDFGRAYAEFLSGLKGKGAKVETVAMVNENTEYGTSTGDAIVNALREKKLNLDLRIPYNANSADVSAQVLQLKNANPDAVIFVSYTSDSILFMKTLRSLDYRPPVLIGDDSGFSDPSFVHAVGNAAEGAINRSSFDPGKPGSNSFKVNELYRKKTGHDLDDTSARGMQGFFVLCDAINRAGATDPAKIQTALKATDLKPDQLMIGYDGVKFDPNGQNQLASTLLVQLREGRYVAIWPDRSAVMAPQLPFKGWS